ncbi:MAG: ACP S-malonyltransferase [Pseudomonadota bacterium]
MKTAFVFPGQGSQTVGMLSDVADQFDLVQQLFKQAADILAYDLSDIVFSGPAEKLNQTIYTQPALLVADVAMWRLWQSQGGRLPDVMAGHSLGEYAALVAAEAISFADGVKLVAKRAALMQSAVPEGEGAMAAIVLLPLEKVEAICQQASEGDTVMVANVNEPNQTVIAGHVAAVERAIALAKQAKAKIAKRLPVSIPSHCPLMLSASENLAEFLQEIPIKSPKIPVISNVDALVHSDPEAIRLALSRQVYCPVRWQQTVESMINQGIERIIECGPGKVLTGLNRRISKQINAFTLNNLDSLRQLLNSVDTEEDV